MVSLWSYLHTGTLPRLISFISHSYENTRGVGGFFPSRYALRCRRRELAILFKFFLFTFLQTLLHFFALSCTRAKLNSFIFNRFCTLRQKNTTTREVRPELQTGCCQLSKRGEMGTGARGAPVPEVGLYVKIKHAQFRNPESHPNEGHVNSP